MKTITLWNVPLEIAELAVKAMREKASKMLLDGASAKDVEKFLYSIETIEDEIQEARNE